MKRLGLWIAGMLGRSRFERDLKDELEFHLRERTEHWRRQGLEPEEARRRARLEFGNVEHVKEIVRETRFGGWFEETRQDVRHALRSFGRSPGLTAVVVLSLAVGIGLNTTVFSVVDAMWLRPLPYDDPGRLVHVEWTSRAGPEVVGMGGIDWDYPSPEEIELWTARQDLIAGMGGASNPNIGGAFVGSDRAPAEPMVSLGVTPDLLPTLGVEPMLGRWFLPEDALPGAAEVVILSHDAWQHLFGGDSNAIGATVRVGDRPATLRATVRVEDRPATVVGVMPPGFDFLRHGTTDFWTPRQNATGMTSFARLAPGVTLQEARAGLQTIAARGESPGETGEWRLVLEPLHRTGWYAGPVKDSLAILWIAGLLMLLAVWANTSCLVLARTQSNRRHAALRMALGASRWRVVRLILAEGAVLALAGAVAGGPVAGWGVSLVRLLNPDSLPGASTNFPGLDAVSLDARASGYALLLMLLTALVISVGPARENMKLNVDRALKALPGASGSLRFRGQRFGRALVVTQVALTMVLLSGAGLLLTSMSNLLRADVGFEPDRLLTLQTVLAPHRYWDETTVAGGAPTALSPRVDVSYEEVRDRLAALPGVESAAGISNLPLSRRWTAQNFQIGGRPIPSADRPWHARAGYVAVVGDYFGTMGIPVLMGRSMNEADTHEAPWVAVINESAAERFWPGENPIGQEITIVTYEPMPQTVERPRRIVGVVADIRPQGPQGDVAPMIHVPARQRPLEVVTTDGQSVTMQRSLRMSYVLRTAGEPTRWAVPAREALEEVGRDQAVTGVLTMQQMLDTWTAGARFYTVLATTFAATTLLLSMVGIYGVLAYSIGRRTHEIGIRMALGANRTGVVRLVVRQGLGLAVAGLVLGMIGAYGLTRFVLALHYDRGWGEEMLFGVSPTDPTTFALVSLLMIGVAALACYRPARRATGVDPLIALRAE